MAHIHDDGIHEVSFKADTDLSGYRYYAATAASTAGYVKLATGASNPAPLGVIQNDTASNAGDAVRVKMFGITKARVQAATSAGSVASDVDMGHYLQVASTGQFYYVGGGGTANARALGFLDSGSGYIEIFFWPFAACDSGDNVI